MAKSKYARYPDEPVRRKALGSGSMRAPSSVDWSAAPDWAMYYAKDEDQPDYGISRSTWREWFPSYSPSSPYGKWGGVGGQVQDAPDFGDELDWGLVPRPA